MGVSCGVVDVEEVEVVVQGSSAVSGGLPAFGSPGAPFAAAL